MLRKWLLVLGVVALTAMAQAQKDEKKDKQESRPQRQERPSQASRPSPSERPAARPAPSERPARSERPTNRPSQGSQPANRPGPGERPATRPAERPSNDRPSVDRPSNNRPGGNDRPGNVRPGNPDRNQGGNARPGGRPEGGNRPSTGRPTGERPTNQPARPGIGNNRPAGGNNRVRVQPQRTTRQVGNRTVSVDTRNRVREIKTRDLTIRHTITGTRRVERTFPGGRRVVVVGRGRGFTERPYRTIGNRTYIQRTYIVRGRPYAVAYRSYYWRGSPYYWYVPPFYYRPVFYGWVYNPWITPVYYNWGWGPDPWYGYYGYYWAPAPVYPSAALWLTDFIIGESLRSAYDARQDSYAAADASSAPVASSGGPTQLTPEVKQAIAEEVRNQLQADQQAAQSGAPVNSNDTPPALDPKNRIFVVSSSLDVVDDNGNECALTAGDVILRTGNDVLDGDVVEASVQSTKKGDCASGSNVQVGVADLQDMQNRFRQNIDAGLGQLADKQAKGLPTPPDTATVQGEVPPPEPDENAQSEINDEQQQADQAEQGVDQPQGDNNNNPQ